MRKKNFTLVELLVVIAIIAILFSMLLPSMKRAKDAALVAVCMSNLKQISVAEYGYIKDNNQFFTPSSLAGDDNHISYDDLLAEYVGIKLTLAQKRTTLKWNKYPDKLTKFRNFFTCPNDKIEPYAKWGPLSQRRSYSFNGAKGDGQLGLGYNGWSINYNSVTNPDNTIMFLEQHHYNNIMTRGNHCYAVSLTKWQLAQEKSPHGYLRFCWALVDGSGKMMDPYSTGGGVGTWGMWKAKQ